VARAEDLLAAATPPHPLVNHPAPAPLQSDCLGSDISFLLRVCHNLDQGVGEVEREPPLAPLLLLLGPHRPGQERGVGGEKEAQCANNEEVH